MAKKQNKNFTLKDIADLSAVGVDVHAENLGYSIIDTNEDTPTEKQPEAVEGRILSAGVLPTGGLWLCCSVVGEKSPVVVTVNKETIDHINEDGNRPFKALDVLEWECTYRTTPMGRVVQSGWVLSYNKETAKKILSEALKDWSVALLYHPSRKKYDILEVWK